MQGGSLTRAGAPPHGDGSPMQQDSVDNDDEPVDQVDNAKPTHHEQMEHAENVKNATLIALGKKVEQAHILKTQCEKYKRKKMELQAQLPAKQTALAESINRANEDIKLFNELNLHHQKLQAQVSESEAELAKARRQTTLSQDEARRKETECQYHAASLAKLADDHTSANREYENEVRSLGLG
jgi:adenylate kinase family enzyme